MSKPAKLALGIGFSGVICGILGGLSSGPLAWFWIWASISCAIATVAYLANVPEIFGKRAGRLVWWRALPSGIYLIAFRISCGVMRAWRRHPPVSRITSDLWVGGRIRARDVPAEVDVIVDLIAEFPAPRTIRAHPGYRSLPILDGGYPPREDQVLALLDELAEPGTRVLVHCDSGIGRAPSFAALLLVRRGEAEDVAAAIDVIRRARPFVRPTSSDRRFLEKIAPRVRSRAPVPSDIRSRKAGP